MAIYAAVCAAAGPGACPLGRPHRHRRLPGWQRLRSTARVAEFSEAYADQNERDYAALVQAEKDGRITVQHGL